MRLLASGGLLVLVAATVACFEAGSGPAGAPRYTALSLLAEESGHTVEVWPRSGDRRITVVHPADGETVRLGPLAGSACTLAFGIGSDAASDAPVAVDVVVGVERLGRVETLLEDRLVVPSQIEPWVNHRVELPASDELFLVFEARSNRPSPARVGWGSPYVVCADGEVAVSEPTKPHVILISIDTLRADHLGFYGYERATSPRLDALASEALVFDRAFAPSPWTLPSHASMLTGLSPFEHRAGHANVFAPMSAEVATVAEHLSDAGYRTVAHTGSGYAGARYGLDRGFTQWTERSFASLDSALPEVLDQLDDDLESPLFLFLHTYSVHAPYLHPPAYESFRERDPDGSSNPGRALASLADQTLHRHLGLEDFTSLRDLVAGYDSTIRFVDTELGRLLDHLEAADVLEHAALIVTSDHGESFLERDLPYISHGYTLLDEELRVPLLVRLPGGTLRGRSDRLVDLADLGSLLLDLAGIEPVSGYRSGSSPLAEPAETDGKLDFVTGGSAFTGGRFGRSGRWKVVSAIPGLGAVGVKRPGELIPGFDLGEQVFDLVEDPGERSNLAGDDASLPAEVWILRQAVGRLEQPGTRLPREQALDAETREQLSALGYLDRAEPPAERPESD